MQSKRKQRKSTGRAGRRHQSQDERQQKNRLFCSVARRVIQQHGAQRASMRLIAREAGVNEATLYLYFKNKVALIQAVAADIYLEYVQDLRKGIGLRSNFAEKVSYFIERDLRVYLEEPELCRLLDDSMRTHTVDVAPTVGFFHADLLELLDECIASGITSGFLRDDLPAKSIRDHLIAMVLGCKVRILYQGETISIVEESRQILELLLRGVQARSAVAERPSALEYTSLSTRLENIEALLTKS